MAFFYIPTNPLRKSFRAQLKVGGRGLCGVFELGILSFIDAEKGGQNGKHWVVWAAYYRFMASRLVCIFWFFTTAVDN